MGGIHPAPERQELLGLEVPAQKRCRQQRPTGAQTFRGVQLG